MYSEDKNSTWQFMYRYFNQVINLVKNRDCIKFMYRHFDQVLDFRWYRISVPLFQLVRSWEQYLVCVPCGSLNHLQHSLQLFIQSPKDQTNYSVPYQALDEWADPCIRWCSTNKVSEPQIPLVRDQRVHDAIDVPLPYNSDDSSALVHSLAPLQRPCEELQ